MDFNDSFTEKIIQRKKARNQYLNEIKSELLPVGKKRAVLIDEHQVNSDEPPNKSPKLQKTQVIQPTSVDNDKENFEMQDEEPTAPFVPVHCNSKARGLNALKNHFLKSEADESSSQAVSEPEETPTSASLDGKSKITDARNIKRSTLEVPDSNDYSDESINEDDFAENYISMKPTDGCNIKTELGYSPFKQTPKDLKSNELQKRGDVDNSGVQNKDLHPTYASKLPSSDSKKNPACTAKEQLPPTVQVPALPNVDPAELPLSARKALFEKALLSGTPKLNENVIDHTLSVAQRAAMFENASKVNKPKIANCKEPKQAAPKILSKFGKTSPVESKDPAKAGSGVVKASPVKKIVSPPTTSVSPVKTVGNHTRFIQQKLIENSGTHWQDKEIVVKSTEERKKEISSLVHQWEKRTLANLEKGSDLDKNNLVVEEPMSCQDTVQQTSKQNLFKEDSNEKRDPTDSEEDPIDDGDEDSSDDNENPNDHNENPNDDNENPNDGAEDPNDETENFSDEPEELYDEATDLIGEAADFSDAEGDQKGDYCNEESTKFENVFYPSESFNVNLKSSQDRAGVSERYGSSSSSQNTRSIMSSLSCSDASSYTSENSYNASGSQSCTSGSSVRSYDVTSSCVNQETPENRKKNPDLPLKYTVSLYRKQKQETRLTPPIQTIVRREKISCSGSSDTDCTELIQERLKALQEEILKQQTVISQTSQALNLCCATAEFSGSTEQVEGERLLLIATQKRQACLNEITRLKTFGAQGESVADGVGTLTISDLQLPLKREFIAAQLEGKGSDTVHYFLCLIRHGAQVIVTQMMSTDEKATDGSLSFTNHIQLRNLPGDFSVIFEVYALQTKKEVLPHEKKYHIKRDHSKIRLTPKGKKSDGKILLPAISSPGGPNAVRSPSFGVVGFTRFTLQNCHKTTFTLDKVPFQSPLDGVLQVKLNLHAELKIVEKGFLTMFEDVSGFGAWHRRWCALDAGCLAYWKYPDDEQRKEPNGIIDLKQCITSQVKPVPRDVCARPHTFQLVTIRPQEKGDKNSLITRSVNTLTTTKHLLSADTKEERVLWCNKLNEALSNLRKWDRHALRPVETMQDH